MGQISTNIWSLSESALKSLKKSDSIQKILDLIGKVVIDADLHKLCEKVERLTESMNQIVAENKKLQSQIAIVKNVNRKLEGKIVYLEKNQAKGSNIAAETTWKYQAYQTAFLIRILRIQWYVFLETLEWG